MKCLSLLVQFALMTSSLKLDFTQHVLWLFVALYTFRHVSRFNLTYYKCTTQNFAQLGTLRDSTRHAIQHTVTCVLLLLQSCFPPQFLSKMFTLHILLFIFTLLISFTPFVAMSFFTTFFFFWVCSVFPQTFTYSSWNPLFAVTLKKLTSSLELPSQKQSGKRR